MAYTIRKSTGELVTVPDNAIDVAYYNPTGGDTSQGLGVQLIGRNTINYGAPIAQNFLQLTENFASTNAPSDLTSLQGQLWFNRLSPTSGDLHVRMTNSAAGGLNNWAKLATVDSSGAVNGNITGNSATATSIAGGSSGDLIYQSATGTTSFVPGGQASFVLTSTGPSTAPAWQAAGGTSLPTASPTVLGGIKIGPGLDINGSGVVSSNGSGMGVVVVSTTSENALPNNQYILINVASTTVILPALPASGDLVWVTWSNSLTTNVVDRNGQSIMGIPENMILDALANGNVQLRFVNNTWRIL